MCHGAIVQAAAPHSSCSSAEFKQMLLHITQWLCDEDGVFWLIAAVLAALYFFTCLVTF